MDENSRGYLIEGEMNFVTQGSNACGGSSVREIPNFELGTNQDNLPWFSAIQGKIYKTSSIKITGNSYTNPCGDPATIKVEPLVVEGYVECGHRLSGWEDIFPFGFQCLEVGKTEIKTTSGEDPDTIWGVDKITIQIPIPKEGKQCYNNFNCNEGFFCTTDGVCEASQKSVDNGEEEKSQNTNTNNNLSNSATPLPSSTESNLSNSATPLPSSTESNLSNSIKNYIPNLATNIDTSGKTTYIGYIGGSIAVLLIIIIVVISYRRLR